MIDSGEPLSGPAGAELCSLLLADGNALLRAGLRSLLGELVPPGAVVDVGSPSEALRLLGDGGFDLALVGDFADIDRERFLTDVIAVSEAARVMIVSRNGDPTVVRRALAGGAAGYLLADTAPEVMLQAIRLALVGGVYVPPVAIGLDARGEATRRIETGPTAGEPQLTARQRSVLDRLAVGESNGQIARGLDISTGAVKAHVSSLLRIFGARNRTELVRLAASRGALAGADGQGRPGGNQARS